MTGDPVGQIRVGLHSGQQYRSFEECRQLWVTAEALGFDVMSLFDHLRPPIGGSDGPCFEGPTLLACRRASAENPLLPAGLRRYLASSRGVGRHGSDP